MEEQHIELKTANEAKDKGFKEYTLTAYIGGIFFENEPTSNGYDGFDLPESTNWNREGWVFDKEGCGCFGCKLDNVKYFEACSAPTQTILQKWLREVHDIRVLIYEGDKPYLTYQHNYSRGHFDTYEEALEEGLYEALLAIKN